MARTHPSRWEIAATRLSSLRSEKIRLDSEIAKMVAAMEQIENTYRDRHPELDDDEFEALLKRAER
jgi:hypothetical protein